jgi:hypothetical protein
LAPDRPVLLLALTTKPVGVVPALNAKSRRKPPLLLLDATSQSKRRSACVLAQTVSR